MHLESRNPLGIPYPKFGNSNRAFVCQLDVNLMSKDIILLVSKRMSTRQKSYFPDSHFKKSVKKIQNKSILFFLSLSMFSLLLLLSPLIFLLEMLHVPAYNMGFKFRDIFPPDDRKMSNLHYTYEHFSCLNLPVANNS